MRIKRKIRLKGQLPKKPDNVITVPEPAKPSTTMELLGEVWAGSADCSSCGGRGWEESDRLTTSGQTYPVPCHLTNCQAGVVTRFVWSARQELANRLRRRTDPRGSAGYDQYGRRIFDQF